ncbi:restriction endonuclease subunit S [Candidatus Methylopumilus planktonicus]|uniref:restriction endonuclease subunit S n=1 Tax=Candidatus Methylopumilus planktonicus TaxID=1581557 RepID=UPI001122834E|nr:restriction endonuclease subunit S [Candidatus Methylopumilus planktonicus]QDC99782.1 hypothetical protein FIT68_00625 [Candidatus Methylopumilus planktonicus]
MKMSTPALRFKNISGKEFSIWQKKNLGSIADVTKLAGYEFTKHIVYSDNGNIIALRALNVKDNKLDLTDVKYIDESDFSKLNRSMLIVNDLLFTYIGTIGEVALIVENNRFYLAPNVARIRLDENLLLPSFALQYFNNSDFKKKQINLYIATSSQPALSMENIRKFEINLPSIPEQNKIANFLSAMDEKITQLNQKHGLLNKYKKGAMQKIFSQELRFKDGDGNYYPQWEKKKLSQIAMCIKDSKDIPNQFFYIDLTSVKKGRLLNPIFYNKEEAPASAKKIPAHNDILFQTVRPYQKNNLHYKLEGSYICSTAYAQLRPQEDPNFLFQVIHYDNFVNEVNKRAAGSTYPVIKEEDLMGIQINMPAKKEQIKIANFLSAIDEKIAVTQSELHLTKQYKQGLLQQMFI